VGTKALLAAELGMEEGLGEDLVHHCVNDIVVMGARPLFFLDYCASRRLSPQRVARVVGAMARACRRVGAALLGGETAEMPGAYATDGLELVGTIVGVVERGRIIDGSRLSEGDLALALPSSGLHTNGYSLVRRALAGRDLHAPEPLLGGQSLAEALLAPHRCYLAEIQALQGLDLRGLVHITGGGLVHNPPRVLPPGLALRLDRGCWTLPPLQALLADAAGLGAEELPEVFNCGLGMLILLPAAQGQEALARLPEAVEVGRLEARRGPPVVGLVD
jgi:phosphoribosylformylglycinamidine cyclo-ligase